MTGATERTHETKPYIVLFFPRLRDRVHQADFTFTGAVPMSSPLLRRIRLPLGEAGEFIVHKPVLSLD